MFGNESKTDGRRRGGRFGPFTGRQLAIVTAAVGAMVMYPVVASAVIPNGNTYNACALKTTGALRVIDTSKHQVCKKTETKLSWAKAGTPGARGADGAKGATGATGAAGDPNRPLASHESESGTFGATDNFGTATPHIVEANLVFARPVTSYSFSETILTSGSPSANCTGAGHAAPGYLCIYDVDDAGVVDGHAFVVDGSPHTGTVAYWDEAVGGFSRADGTYTITAP